MIGFILLLVLVFETLSHELCLDPNIPILDTTQLLFCSEFSLKPTCCSNSRDSELQNFFISIVPLVNSQTCKDVLKKVVCSSCDAWEAHLFEINPTAPTLCSNFCTEIYSNCQNELLTSSMFNPGQTSTIKSLFPTEDSFCSAFAPTSASYCTNGTPFVLPESEPAPDNYELCLEHLSDYDNDLIGVVPVPKRFDVLISFTRRGIVRILSQITGKINLNFGNDGFIGPIPITVSPSGGSEQGLLSMAFPEDYVTTGRFYVYGNLVTGSSIDTAIQEWTCVLPQDFKNCESSGYVLQLFQPFSNHNGGTIFFAVHDPTILFLTTGDGGSACDPQNFAQRDASLLGKIIRIRLPSGESAGNFNYDIPLDNPLVNRTNVEMCGKSLSRQRNRLTQTCSETWAKGFRNPYRCSIDRFDPEKEYKIYCGDVGQNRFEETDMIPSFGLSTIPNYGWDYYEGEQSASLSSSTCNDASINCPKGYKTFVTTPFRMECPLSVHSHSSGWAAIIGGIVCRYCDDPVLLNRYIFGDYFKKGILSMNPTNPSDIVTLSTKLCTSSTCNQPESGGFPLKSAASNVWSFTDDNHGRAYIINPDRGLYRILSQNQCNTRSPVSSVTSSPTTIISTKSPTKTPTKFPTRRRRRRRRQRKNRKNKLLI